ncbi:Ribonuclease HII [Caloramator mitchellensis]|uniref:Ribonuclease HII n=1 Tax=Caloramator mitchellensis TaxID=908809 RepID=A0A0R3JTU1_CALMK|nr:ribonuclease HII [Caloramator mitchellensis]KRQ86966.1 Ribonuclease HII [Caloramator mitchellensis]
MLRVDEIKVMIDKCISIEELNNLKSEILKVDSRKTVINLFDKRLNKILKENELIKEYIQRSIYEEELYKQYTYVAGIDEVGRGPLAGPVYAAVVILDKNKRILGIKDSKKLSEKAREKIYCEIIEKSVDYSIGIASQSEIDELNILIATKLAMIRAIENLKIKPDYLLIDAVKLDVEIPQKAIIKGDDLSVSIGAASIIAKVERDRFMKFISEKYPEYKFDENKGYGTKEHIEALKKFGPCELHRKSFIKNL